jgi:hypothetical protein
MSTASAPVALVQPRTLRGIVDDARGAENRAGACACRAERRALPEHRARLVDHTRRVDHRPDREVRRERAGDAERDQPSLRHAPRSAEPDERSSAEASRDALLDRHRARERQPVSVQAMLRTLSLIDPAASYAADGSKPEWIPQCSQRGSLPGPYSSHSMPSSSASYVGKIPSVRR